MAKLIDANDVYALFDTNGFARMHVADIDVIPRVDAVEVVRCKDCVYYHKELGYGFGQCSKSNLMPYPDDFCSYGERRGGE